MSAGLWFITLWMLALLALVGISWYLGWRDAKRAQKRREQDRVRWDDNRFGPIKVSDHIKKADQYYHDF